MTAPGPDRSHWLNDEQACAALGISERTLDRKVKDRKLNPSTRPVAGRTHPERIFDPDEIRAQTRQTPAVVLSKEIAPTAPETTPKTTPTAPAMTPLSRLQPEDAIALVPLIEMVLDARREMERPPTPWATLKEAAAELGLTHKGLRRIVKAGGVRAIRDVSIKIQREDYADIDFSSIEVETPKKPERKRGRK